MVSSDTQQFSLSACGVAWRAWAYHASASNRARRTEHFARRSGYQRQRGIVGEAEEQSTHMHQALGMLSACDDVYTRCLAINTVHPPHILPTSVARQDRSKIY